MNRSLQKNLARIAVALTSIVVILGAYTRLVDAGLGCPDWPGCYGFLTVPSTETDIATANARFPATPLEVEKGWPEMIHRYAASSLGLLVLVMTGIGFSRSRTRSDIPLQGNLNSNHNDSISGQQRAFEPKWLMLIILAVVIIQGLFGMWTVTLKLWPQVVTLHLMGGFTTLSLLWWLNLKLSPSKPLIFRSQDQKNIKSIQLLAQAALLIVILQIVLGGWTASNYAAFACPELPTCQSQWWPNADYAKGFNIFQHIGPNYLGGLLNNEARVAIHFSHRLGAILTFTLVCILCYRLWQSTTGLVAKKLLMTILGLLMLQVGLGITNVLTHIQLYIAVAHNAVGAMLLLSLVTLNFRLKLIQRQTSAESMSKLNTQLAQA